MRSTL